MGQESSQLQVAKEDGRVTTRALHPNLGAAAWLLLVKNVSGGKELNVATPDSETKSSA